MKNFDKDRVVCNIEIKTPERTLLEAKGLKYEAAKKAVLAVIESNPDDKIIQEHLRDCYENFGFMGFGGAGGYNFTIDVRYPTTQTNEKQTCPRRMNEMGPWEHKENLDTWEMRGDDKCCSFCGSLHPDRVIELVKKHGFGIIEPSTKGYKWYIHRADVPNAGFGGIKYYRMHDTPEFIETWNNLIDKSKKIPE